jgi:DNA-binding transcriptional LysR family regulator
MIDRYHLRYFLAVIDQGNFSKAARFCNVSQPTLSVGISKLEQSLGTTLFNRNNRRVELTRAGGQLVSYARRIEESFALAERNLRGAVDAKPLRLGVLVTTPRRWIAAFLNVHRASSSQDRIEIVEGRERDLQDRLARGRIDAALTIIRDEPAKGDREIIFSEGYSLAMAATHPLSDRSAIAAEELINEPMILRRQCELLSETSRHFTARGVRPFFPARTMSDDRAIDYVKAGLGITVMPDGFADPGIVRPLMTNFTFRRNIGLIYGPDVASAELRSRGPLTLLVRTMEDLRSNPLRD